MNEWGEVVCTLEKQPNVCPRCVASGLLQYDWTLVFRAWGGPIVEELLADYFISCNKWRLTSLSGIRNLFIEGILEVALTLIRLHAINYFVNCYHLKHVPLSLMSTFQRFGCKLSLVGRLEWAGSYGFARVISLWITLKSLSADGDGLLLCYANMFIRVDGWALGPSSKSCLKKKPLLKSKHFLLSKDRHRTSHDMVFWLVHVSIKLCYLFLLFLLLSRNWALLLAVNINSIGRLFEML